MDILPAIDILDGRAVRLLRGDYQDVTVYHEDPAAVASRWTEEGAELIHVVDLEAARGGDRQDDVVARVAAAGAQIQLGGGIRTSADARRALSSGAIRVVVGSTLVDADPTAMERMVSEVGPEAIVGAVDVRNGRALGHGWTGDGMDVAAVLARCVSLGIPRVLATGIDVDGTMDGPSVHLLELVRSSAPSIGLIASGGVGTLEDVRSLAAGGDVEGVIVGRALYEGRFGVSDAIAAVQA